MTFPIHLSISPITLNNASKYQTYPQKLTDIEQRLNIFIKEIFTIMLKKQYQSPLQQDPLSNIFQQGMEEFITYQKIIPSQHKSRNQRHKEKLERMQRDFNDEKLKKERNAKRRDAEKKKLHEYINTLSQEELKVFLEERKRLKIERKEKVRAAMGTGQIILIDCAYEERMNGKENKSLGKQIELIMKGIKHVEAPPSIHVCSFVGGIQVQLTKMSYSYWPLTTHLENVVETGKQLGKKVVYLSPDAEVALENVEEDTAYVIGGLIDRTILKNASLMRAAALKIEARKLPIRQFMRSRIVLNIDHVVLILCKYKQCKDWKQAFDYGAPKRYKRDAYEGTKGEEGCESQSESQKEEKRQEGEDSDEEQQEDRVRIKEETQEKAKVQTLQSPQKSPL